MAAIAEAKAKADAEQLAMIRERQRKAAEVRAERKRATLARLAQEAEDRRVQQERDFEEQMRKWRAWRDDKQDELRDELQYTLAQEGPDWITDPEQISEDSLFTRQVLLDGYWPEKDPLYAKTRQPGAHDSLLGDTDGVPFASRMEDVEEDEIAQFTRKEAERAEEYPKLYSIEELEAMPEKQREEIYAGMEDAGYFYNYPGSEVYERGDLDINHSVDDSEMLAEMEK